MRPGLPTASVVRSSQATPARRRGQPCIADHQPAADPLISPLGRVQASGATSLVRPGRERLVGTVEVDETYIGGRNPGVGRGKGRGDKVLTGIAVEIKEPRGYGRCRLAPLPDASAASLCAFVADHVEPSATVITDGWKGYLGLDRRGYTHEARSQRAARLRGDGQAAELLAAVHRVASLAKRWILGTHQKVA